MSDTPTSCVRGCLVRDEHLDTCPTLAPPPDEPTADDEEPKPVPTCSGCVPAEVRPGARICDRCYRKAKRHLEDAPDLVALLRSRADPMKSGWNFDRLSVSSSRPELPAPVAADLIDACDDIVRTLAAWSHFARTGHPADNEHHGLTAGTASDVAYHVAHAFADDVLAHLEGIAGESEISSLLDALTARGGPDVVGFWTVASVLSKWPLDDRTRWATAPCPECDLKTVKISPPRGRRVPARYACLTCEWSRTDRDDGGFFAEIFEDRIVEHRHEEKVTVDAMPADCSEGECDHLDESGERAEECPLIEFTVCVDCMDEADGTRDPEVWGARELALMPWPHAAEEEEVAAA